MSRDHPLLGETEYLGTEFEPVETRPGPVVDVVAVPASIVVETRDEWGALPPKGNPGGFEALEGTVCHYTAGAFGYMVRPDEPHEWCREQVRSIQRQHQSDPDQTDISYNALACAHRVIFEGRVLGYRGGANGDSTSNRREPSICALIGVDDDPPESLLDVLRAFHAAVEERAGESLTMYKHSQRTSTSCPGPILGAWVDAGKYRSTVPIPHPPEDDMPRIGPYLIQATGADGTETGLVFATDGNMMTVRPLRTTEELEGYRWTMTHYGASAPELAPGAPIMPVDTIAAYGVVLE